METNKEIILEKHFPTPEGHEDAKAIYAAMEEYAELRLKEALKKVADAKIEMVFAPCANNQEPKWEVKEWGDENYALTNGTIIIVTADATCEHYLQAIVDLLNGSGYRFHSENKLELDLHLAGEECRLELQQWKERAKELEQENSRLKEALTNIKDPIQYLRKEAEKEGGVLDGHFAVLLSKDESFLKSIAAKALNNQTTISDGKE
jgi:hypothetical protein